MCKQETASAYDRRVIASRHYAHSNTHSNTDSNTDSNADIRSLASQSHTSTALDTFSTSEESKSDPAKTATEYKSVPGARASGIETQTEIETKTNEAASATTNTADDNGVGEADSESGTKIVIDGAYSSDEETG